MKHIIEVYIRKLEKGDNWLMTKKASVGHNCASCENYLGDIQDHNMYVPWNKYPTRETTDKVYRVN